MNSSCSISWASCSSRTPSPALSTASPGAAEALRPEGNAARTDEQAVLALPRWLEEAGAKGRVLLLVDDVDSWLPDAKEEFQLDPAGLPANVRLICTPSRRTSGGHEKRCRQCHPSAAPGEGGAGADHRQPVQGLCKKLEPQYVSALAAAPQTRAACS